MQEIDKVERLVYFVRKAFMSTGIRYQKIKSLALTVVMTVRNLKPYFQGHRILVKTDYRVRRVLKKLDIAERMVSWAVKLSKYDIHYIPRGNIK